MLFCCPATSCDCFFSFTLENTVSHVLGDSFTESKQWSLLITILPPTLTFFEEPLWLYRSHLDNPG
jgi:hypothetical protein